MKRLPIIVFLLGTIALFGTTLLWGQPGSESELSHSGGTDKCGCHYNRKTGEYHCHNRRKRGGDCPA